MRLLRSVVVALLIPLGASAQPLTLSMAEHEALENNPSLRAQRYDVPAADADIKTANLFPNNPQLSLYGDVTPTGGFGIGQYGGSLAFPIELGGKRDARVDVATEQKKSTEQTVNDASRTLLLTVRTAFADALQAKAELDLAQKNLVSLDSVVALNRIRVNAHELAESELMRSELEAEQTRSDLASSQIDFEKSLIDLQTAMGRKTFSSTIVIDGDLTAAAVVTVASLDDAKAFAHEHRADLIALRNTVGAQEANQRLQEANATIDLSLSADFQWQQGVAFYGSTISLPIPLFNRNQGEREKAVVHTTQAEEQVRALELQVDADVEAAFREFTARRAIVERMKKEILPRAQAVRATVEYAYTSGGTSILDFLEAQREYNNAMSSWFAALGAQQKSVFALHAAMGE